MPLIQVAHVNLQTFARSLRDIAVVWPCVTVLIMSRPHIQPIDTPDVNLFQKNRQVRHRSPFIPRPY